MILREALERADAMKPNGFEAETKIRWISELDGKVFDEIITKHQGNTRQSFGGYGAGDMETELLIGFPHDDAVYIAYLEAKIDEENGEIGKYNASRAFFNEAWQTYADSYNRLHKPISGGGWTF